MAIWYWPKPKHFYLQKVLSLLNIEGTENPASKNQSIYPSLSNLYILVVVKTTTTDYHYVSGPE